MIDPQIKDHIKKMNDLFGRVGFSLDEILELSENEEFIPPENIAELQTQLEEMKDIWKNIRTNIK